jgi:phosphinothricin acetyltransferase
MDGYVDKLAAEDWPRVRDIYEAGMATRMATFETRLPSWEEWDAKYLKHSRLVFRADDEVAAWAALMQISSRPVYAGVCEHSIYVAEAWRGRGIGSRLLAAFIAESEKNGVWTLQSSVFPENDASVQLHIRHGFRVVGRRERIAQLDGVWRDTLLLERRSNVVG